MPSGNIIKTGMIYLAGLFTSAIFLDSLRFKFTGHETPHHIFTTLRDWSGIDLFYPAGPWIIGLGELASALLLIVIALFFRFTGKPNLEAVSQSLGALAGLGIMTGAIGFHVFTPLGIPTPVTWENSVAIEESSDLFVAACITWVCCALILVLRGPMALSVLKKD
jgi:hypothetical protein